MPACTWSQGLSKSGASTQGFFIAHSDPRLAPSQVFLAILYQQGVFAFALGILGGPAREAVLRTHPALPSAAFFRSGQGPMPSLATSTRLQHLRFRGRSSLSYVSELDAGSVFGGGKHDIDYCGFGSIGFAFTVFTSRWQAQDNRGLQSQFLGSQGRFPSAAQENHARSQPQCCVGAAARQQPPVLNVEHPWCHTATATGHKPLPVLVPQQASHFPAEGLHHRRQPQARI